MAAHLLRWTAIQRAKEVGCDKYDMWGIAPRSGAMPSPHGQARSALRGAIVSPHGQARTGIASRRDAIDSPHDQAQRASSDAMYPWQKRQIKQWAGFTQFKQGFGGRVVEYVGTWDLPLRSTWYRLYQLARYARRQAALF
ncbi:peptidoglycan bridge formation glycyltransferase FemA/FemB family protein [Candidatus Parcubacteria bacterium]|nr:peptidoglycan bridge formation glycyltransferase FemA/FemB family protein [Candidatus Parcubacteria bacterium]